MHACRGQMRTASGRDASEIVVPQAQPLQQQVSAQPLYDGARVMCGRVVRRTKARSDRARAVIQRMHRGCVSAHSLAHAPSASPPLPHYQHRRERLVNDCGSTNATQARPTQDPRQRVSADYFASSLFLHSRTHSPPTVGGFSLFLAFRGCMYECSGPGGGGEAASWRR